MAALRSMSTRTYEASTPHRAAFLGLGGLAAPSTYMAYLRRRLLKKAHSIDIA